MRDLLEALLACVNEAAAVGPLDDDELALAAGTAILSSGAFLEGNSAAWDGGCSGALSPSWRFLVQSVAVSTLSTLRVSMLVAAVVLAVIAGWLERSTVDPELVELSSVAELTVEALDLDAASEFGSVLQCESREVDGGCQHGADEKDCDD